MDERLKDFFNEFLEKLFAKEKIMETGQKQE